MYVWAVFECRCRARSIANISKLRASTRARSVEPSYFWGRPLRSRDVTPHKVRLAPSRIHKNLKPGMESGCMQL